MPDQQPVDGRPGRRLHERHLTEGAGGAGGDHAEPAVPLRVAGEQVDRRADVGRALVGDQARDGRRLTRVDRGGRGRGGDDRPDADPDHAAAGRAEQARALELQAVRRLHGRADREPGHAVAVGPAHRDDRERVADGAGQQQDLPVGDVDAAAREQLAAHQALAVTVDRSVGGPDGQRGLDPVGVAVARVLADHDPRDAAAARPGVRVAGVEPAVLRRHERGDLELEPAVRAGRGGADRGEGRRAVGPRLQGHQAALLVVALLDVEVAAHLAGLVGLDPAVGDPDRDRRLVLGRALRSYRPRPTPRSRRPVPAWRRRPPRRPCRRRTSTSRPDVPAHAAPPLLGPRADRSHPDKRRTAPLALHAG